MAIFSAIAFKTGNPRSAAKISLLMSYNFQTVRGKMLLFSSLIGSRIIILALCQLPLHFGSQSH